MLKWYVHQNYKFVKLLHEWVYLKKMHKVMHHFIVYCKSFVMLCVIWFHLNNSQNVKNTHGAVLLLSNLQAVKATLLHGCFSRFLNCTNGTKLFKGSRLILLNTTKERTLWIFWASDENSVIMWPVDIELSLAWLTLNT